MASKMNWACNACGMASGRKESVQRHINNPKIHNGDAIAIPFVQYLARLAGGAGQYTLYNPFRTPDVFRLRNSDEQQVKGSFFDRIHEKAMEKTIDKIAERMVNHTTSLTPPFLSMQKGAHQIQQTSFSYPGESIFGIGGYVCEECLIIKPVIFAYSNASDDRGTLSFFYPMRLCYGSRLRFGSPQEQMDYIGYNKENGFPTALQTWTKTIWSKGQNMKLISLQIHGTKGSCSEADALNEASPRLSNSSNANGNCIGDKRNTIRIVVEQSDLRSPKRSITLSYDDSEVIQMNRVLSIGNHPSIRSMKISNAPILMAIEKSELLITAEEDLLSFLSFTRFKTFGFFGIENESYLVMLIPDVHSLNRSYTCQLLSRS